MKLNELAVGVKVEAREPVNGSWEPGIVQAVYAAHDLILVAVTTPGGLLLEVTRRLDELRPETSDAICCPGSQACCEGLRPNGKERV